MASSSSSSSADTCKACGAVDSKVRRTGTLVCTCCGVVDESSLETTFAGVEFKYTDQFSSEELEDENFMVTLKGKPMLVDPGNRVCLRVREAISIAEEILRSIPNFNYTNNFAVSELLQVFKKIYTNCLRTWSDLKRTDQKFSCPKNQKVTICACIYCAVRSMPKRFTLLPDQIINASLAKLHDQKAAKHFREKVFKFITKLQERGIDSALPEDAMVHTEYNFREALFGAMMNLEIPPFLRAQVLALYDTAKGEVWLGGKDPKNLPATAFHHVLFCDKTVLKNEKQQEQIKEMREKKSLMQSIQLTFNIKPKMLLKCAQIFTEKHHCSCVDVLISSEITTRNSKEDL